MSYRRYTRCSPCTGQSCWLLSLEYQVVIKLHSLSVVPLLPCVDYDHDVAMMFILLSLNS